ncbi:hypothetical protein COOONC_21750 [Cooperia oncophora]
MELNQFRLASLLVATDSGKGFPCCLLAFLSDDFGRIVRVWSRRLYCDEHLNTTLQKSIPHFDTRYIMTDDTNVFYSTFNSNFPQSRAQKILCSFHISKCVQRKLSEALRAEDAKLAQKLFRELFHEAIPARFEQKYAAFITWLHSIEAEAAVQYMERYYLVEGSNGHRATEELLHLRRQHHAESWHNTLKHTLLHEQQNSRSDNLVFTLVRHTADLEMKLLSQRDEYSLTKEVIRRVQMKTALIWINLEHAP